MSTPMYDVPSICLTKGCEKAFGHDLDPDDLCGPQDALSAINEARGAPAPPASLPSAADVASGRALGKLLSKGD